MHRLIINKLGPVKRCELECSSFMTFTGFQAAGKSTIAKAVYYFRTVKDDIIEMAKRQALSETFVNGFEDEFDAANEAELKKGLENYLQEKFFSTFGSSKGMSYDMSMEYQYTESCYMKISQTRTNEKQVQNEIKIVFSSSLEEFLKEKNNCFSVTPLGIPDDEIRMLKRELYRLFDDIYSVVYIPAGRSMITLLSQQLGFIYAYMTDSIKRSLDRCTRDYLERILRMKPEFSDGLLGAVHSDAVQAESAKLALSLIRRILRGSYRYADGEERIVLDDGSYVKINFSSSGQQECVWILNLLFYYLVRPERILFIIEEPESHLFPESQKAVTELIALVNNCGHSVMLTTHSPYVLGALNNLLYAHTIQTRHLKKACQIIPELLWIDENKFNSWFVKNGTIENCMDSDIHMIQNERIDEISKVINQEFDELLELQETDGEGVV